MYMSVYFLAEYQSIFQYELCVLILVFWSTAGAVCVGFRAVGMPLLETRSSPVHVLPHLSSTETMD